MITEKNRIIINKLHKIDTWNYQNLKNLLDMAIIVKNQDQDIEVAIREAKFVKDKASILTRSDIRAKGLYFDSLLLLAPYDLDSYLIYIEKNRPANERFYLPRRKTLIKIVQKIQDLADDKLDELFLHMPPRCGKTQLATFAICWWSCRNPEQSNLYCSYADSVALGFYNGCLEVMTDPTYCHLEVFPNSQIEQTKADEHTIDLVRKKKYKSITCKGLTSGLNGQCDCNGLNLIDDIIEGIQDCLNSEVLKRKWTIVDNNLLPRAKMNAKRIWLGTIWDPQDPYSLRLDYLQNEPKAQGIRWEILKVPALDENEESNFEYDYEVGFSTEYFLQRRASFERNEDMVSWYCQYQQDPQTRQGNLFSPQYMKFYNGNLPGGEPDAILAACDVALGGSDYCSFVIGYQYGDEVYIHDVMFDEHDKEITRPRIVEKIIMNDVGSALFEANQGGELYREWIDDRLKEKGHKINIRSQWAPTNKRKEQRIFDNQSMIREFYFREDGYRDKDYSKFMNNVYSFKVVGKNKNDDSVDSLALLCSLIQGCGGLAKMSVGQRRW